MLSFCNACIPRDSLHGSPATLSAGRYAALVLGTTSWRQVHHEKRVIRLGPALRSGRRSPGTIAAADRVQPCISDMCLGTPRMSVQSLGSSCNPNSERSLCMLVAEKGRIFLPLCQNTADLIQTSAGAAGGFQRSKLRGPSSCLWPCAAETLTRP